MLITPRPNPYPGPRAFEPGETLYGRRRDTRQLLNLLIAERIVLLYSPSGAGKTSLMQAALVPELEAEGFRVLPPMRVSLEAASRVARVRNRYVFSLLLSLEAGLDEAEQTPVDALAGMTLDEYLAQQPGATSSNGSSDQLLDADDWYGDVLIFDQFEEILNTDPTDRAAKMGFFMQVGEALQNRQRWALFAMREEFVAGLDPYLLPLPHPLCHHLSFAALGPRRGAPGHAAARPGRERRLHG